MCTFYILVSGKYYDQQQRQVIIYMTTMTPTHTQAVNIQVNIKTVHSPRAPPTSIHSIHKPETFITSHRNIRPSGLPAVSYRPGLYIIFLKVFRKQKSYL